jgi:hypothetical protein
MAVSRWSRSKPVATLGPRVPLNAAGFAAPPQRPLVVAEVLVVRPEAIAGHVEPISH